MDAISPADFLQAERLLTIETPLGKDAFLMERFSGREMVNGLFHFEAAVRAKRDDVSPQDIVGKNVTVSLDLGEGRRRLWNGLVTNLVEEPRLTRNLRQYVLTMRPDLWLLSQRSDCRIWQNQTTLDIAKALFSEHGLAAPDGFGVDQAPPAQEYSVQWNETDLAYLLRRLEEDGLYYWIRQKDGKQTLVISDTPTRWDEGADGKDGAERYATGSTDRNHINAWRRTFAFTPGKRAGRDWNFETPNQVPGAFKPSLVKMPRNAEYELYEYPSRALDTDANNRASRLRIQATEVDHEAIEALSTVRTLAPGAKVTPYDVADPEHTFETAVVTWIEHEASDTTYETGSGEPSYRNLFGALPARLPATPHRRTARPRIDGSQIALIAGPEGEEIHTDQYGRIKLQFPWDRRAKKDGSDTKWVRVAQPWAGGQWGSQVIPRIGMEAVVTYEGGDPDRPLVTALVPNPVQKVPYDLPGHKTKMVLRSNSHKAQGYNEVSFEDEAGKENLFLHAQKDQTTKVLNNQASRVDANALHSVGANHSLEIGSNMSQQVGGGLNMVIGGVGGAANAIAGGLLGALSANSAGLLQQAMTLAGAAAANAPSSANRNADAAGAAVGAPPAQSGGGGMGDMVAKAAGYAGLMSSGALGAMAAGMDAARGGLNDAKPSGLRADAGDGMRNSGSKLGGQVGSMIGQGVLNALISRMQNTSVGIAQTEQVGVAKVVNVGQVYNQNVGHTKRVTIGQELFIGVGGGKDKDGKEQPPKSILLMKADGTILIKGVRIYTEAESHIQNIAPMVDNN